MEAAQPIVAWAQSGRKTVNGNVCDQRFSSGPNRGPFRGAGLCPEFGRSVHAVCVRTIVWLEQFKLSDAKLQQSTIQLFGCGIDGSSIHQRYADNFFECRFRRAVDPVAGRAVVRLKQRYLGHAKFRKDKLGPSQRQTVD
jgi:hypothetical protein